MKKVSLSFIVLGLALSFTTQAHTEHCVFAPKNNLEIPDVKGPFAKMAGGIDQATFTSILNKIGAIYVPIVAAKGGTLKMNNMWTTNEVNSSADRKGKIWNVNAYGGLARYPLMTPDGEAMVICHELGHHLGGFPKGAGIFGGSSWASNEGQADYYATMKCFRRVYEKENNSAVIAGMSIPKEVTAGCTRTFKSTAEIALCVRSSMAAKTLADILYALGHGNGGPEPAQSPGFNTVTTTQVSATNNQHPLAQCRLDTYFNGAICGVSYTEDFGVSDPVTGACAEEKHDKIGFRPRCWYKPKI